ncbi:MAG: DUF2341 domain-containing protein [Myxococcota bacterium]
MLWALAALPIASATPWHEPTRDRRVRFDYTNPAPEALTDFPVLVALDSTRIAYADAHANGWDLRFVDAAGTALSFDLDTWDAAGTSYVWVRLPSVASSGSGSFWMYYDANVVVSGSPSNPDATWGNAWVGVWHLNQLGESQGRYTGTYGGTNDNVNVPARIGSGRYFSGNDHIEVGGNENDFDLDVLTISAWVRREGWFEEHEPVVAKGDDAWRLHRRATTDDITLSYDRTNNQNVDPDPSGSIADDTWVHIYATYDSGGGGRVRLYHGATSRLNDASQGAIDDQSERVRIGHNIDNGRHWRGWIDELQIQNVARSSNWVIADHASHSDTFITSRCDSGTGTSGNVHDADGDGFSCDVDCNDGNASIGVYYEDLDGDGEGSAVIASACAAGPMLSATTGDCDDGDPAINTSASEICDGVDNDCAGGIDDGLPTFDTFVDDDGDGYGTGTALPDCEIPSGFAGIAGDCNDGDPNLHPNAVEICDGIDQDCDGTADDGLATSTWYRDQDGDLFGTGLDTVSDCAQPSGYVGAAGDCDDAAIAVNPSATEVCDGVDNDCNGTADVGAVDQAAWFRDADSDTYGDPADSVLSCDPVVGYVDNPDDCDDSTGLAYPGGTEVCDAFDNDCNGTVNDNAVGAPTWYRDNDSDGYGDLTTTTTACSQPTGYVADFSDCNDVTSEAHPGATEVCDGLDNDCNGTVDVGATDPQTWYRDFDGDGYGSNTVTQITCTPAPGYIATSGDCNDAVATVNPGAMEMCNGVDDNCVGGVDEGLTVARFPDNDGDGFGATVVAVPVCPSQPGYVDVSGDCNDMDASIGLQQAYYRDQDGDQAGDANTSTLSCNAPMGFVLDDQDCNDLEPLSFPGNTELCDGVDNDCDGTVDQGVSIAPLWYPDSDGDGHGQAGGTSVQACSRPAGYRASFDDCDDTEPAAFPTNPESCDGIDNDCNGLVDDGTADRFWFVDTDGDGFGDALGNDFVCAPPPGQVGQGGDCDDSNADVNPNGTEVCNTLDDDCDGTTDLAAEDAVPFYLDADQDGYGVFSGSVEACTAPSGFAAVPGDCDDTTASATPAGSVPETCDGLDNDCNGFVDDGDDRVDVWPDLDQDGFGDVTLPSVLGCPSASWVTDSSDCNDFVATVYPPVGATPGGTEVCDLLDNDCNGLIDDADPNVVPSGMFWPDDDGDGYGDPSQPVEACEAPPGTVDNPDDCDDDAADVSPDGDDLPGNGIDEDCDGADATIPLETADTSAPEETDVPVETDLPTGDTFEEGPTVRRKTGCRCDHSGGSGWLWGVVGLVAVRMRSRRE